MALELVKLSPRAVDARCTSSTFHRKCGRMGKLRSTMRIIQRRGERPPLLPDTPHRLPSAPMSSRVSAVRHEHGHGEAVDDEVALLPRLDVEEVVADRGAEELPDLVVVAGVGERAG